MFPVTSFPALGLYIHWPFCLSKCPYCDFNSHVRAAIDEDRWEKAFLKELAWIGAHTQGRQLETVFFGGGTPSLMPPQLVERVLEGLGNYWSLSNTLEITLEGNPTSIEREKYKAFKAVGINRVSIGVQSLRPEALSFLGRTHSVEDIYKALEIGRSLFENFSFDLIYARPHQTWEVWEQELREALALSGGHLSLYQLTIEPGTAFATQVQRGDFSLPEEETAARLYEKTESLLEQQGYRAYEVSNYAKPGYECRHNLIYWRSQDYACVGPGAHGRLTMGGHRYALKNFRAPETWLSRVETYGHGQEEKVALTPREHLEEYILMGLRLREGISDQAFYHRFGKTLEESLHPEGMKLLSELGMLEVDSQGLRATSKGRLILNALLEKLLTSPRGEDPLKTA